MPSIADDLIEIIHGGLETTGERLRSKLGFVPGRKVHVVVGDTCKLATIIETPRNPNERVRILLEFLGRVVTATVPSKALRLPDLVETSGGQMSRFGRRTRGRGRRIGAVRE